MSAFGIDEFLALGLGVEMIDQARSGSEAAVNIRTP
jgi:hypothetical protein